MVWDVIRDAPFGQLVRYATNGKYFSYPEERKDFKLPAAWQRLVDHPEERTQGDNDNNVSSSSTTVADGQEKQERQDSGVASNGEKIGDEAQASSGSPDRNVDGAVAGESQAERRPSLGERSLSDHNLEADEMHEVSRTKSIPITPKTTKSGVILVDWYATDDPANPHNWSNRKRLLLTLLICGYTFVVYTTSAIYTSSVPGIMSQFGVSSIVSTLGLSMYVLGYGVGPLIFSPLSEIPVIGRNPVYIITMFLFVILSIPTALVGNFPGFVVLRFITGFFGSPCLASGGASLGDMYSLMNLSYAMMAWVSAAYCGPALGPLLSGFAVPVKGWRWSMYESIWASAPILILMFIFLPETSNDALLLQRARRLRKRTGCDRFMSQSEINQRNMKVTHIFIDALIKPLEITIKDPAVLFVQIYTAIIYGIYYSFFEVFPLVYPVYYGFNLGQIGLVFLCVLVACMIGVSIYVAYLYFYANPQMLKYGLGKQEARLIPALVACFGPTIGLFLFAWTARESIHWIAPTIGITIYGATVFVVMQCIFIYIPLSYPMYAASLFAANDFFRSAFASGSVMFAHPLFNNLGVAKGTSLLGGLSVLGIVGIWLLYFFGARLRAMSKFAVFQAED